MTYIFIGLILIVIGVFLGILIRSDFDAAVWKRNKNRTEVDLSDYINNDSKNWRDR